MRVRPAPSLTGFGVFLMLLVVSRFAGMVQAAEPLDPLDSQAPGPAVSNGSEGRPSHTRGRRVIAADTSTQTLADGAVKDYSGATLVRRGTLKVHYDGIPTQTSSVNVESAGTLRLETTAQQYTFANS